MKLHLIFSLPTLLVVFPALFPSHSSRSDDPVIAAPFSAVRSSATAQAALPMPGKQYRLELMGNG